MRPSERGAGAGAGYCGPGVARDCARCRLLFVSILTYSLSSRASSRSFRTAVNAFPRICNAAARRIAVLLDIVGSFNTRSHVSRSTDSISSFAPCFVVHDVAHASIKRCAR